MIGNEYSEAAVEALDILNSIEEEELNKIPQSFIKFLSSIASHTYKVDFDKNLSLSELKLKDKTKEILGFIYINWLCSDEQREVYKNEIKQEKKENKEKSNTIVPLGFNSSLQNNTTNIENNEITDSNQMIEYKHKNIFRAFIDKIISRFKNG